MNLLSASITRYWTSWSWYYNFTRTTYIWTWVM